MGFKQLCATLFIAVGVLNAIYLQKVFKRKENIGRVLFFAMLAAFMCISSNIVILLTNSYIISSICYSIFFASLDWVLFFLMRFTRQFTREWKRYPSATKAIYIILSADCISMLINPFTEHAMSYNEITFRGQYFLTFNPKFMYELHLILCYLMCAAIFINLVREVVRCPSFYKMKYWMPLIGFLLVVGMNGVFLLARLPVDFSIPTYSLCAVLLYVNTFTFLPRRMLTKTGMLALTQAKEGFLIFDLNGACLLQNECSKKYLGEISSQQEVLDRLGIKDLSLKSDIAENKVAIISNGEEKHIAVLYQVMEDYKGRYMGGFFDLRDITEEENQKRRQAYLAEHDDFTGLYNKRHFYEKVEELLLSNPKEKYYMCVSDIGKFKFINDTYGTEMGDHLILHIAELLKATTPEGGIYGRLESDKFASFIKKDDFAEEVFIKQSTEVMITDGALLPVVQYLGIYEVDDPTLSVNIMCDRAILAVNSIKGHYHEQIAYYDEKLRKNFINEQEILGEFRTALEREEFVIYLQPQINYSGNEIVGAEALVRWNHPTKGLLAPGAFLPILERNALVPLLDKYVWEKACQMLSCWKKQGYGERSISINISPKDMYFIDIFDILTGFVQKYDIDPSKLKLELTESSFVHDTAEQIKLMERLHDVGFLLEMDDFGSGYSSLNMLKDIPVDILKMDMAFLGASDYNKRKHEILRCVVELAKRLNMPVIAEGVETADEAKHLADIGCELMQGYLYAKPMPHEDYEEFLGKYEYRDIHTFIPDSQEE